MTTINTNTSQAAISKKALAELAKLGGQLTTEDDVLFEGTKFVVPTTVKNLREAGKILLQRAEDEEAETRFTREFGYRPWDVAAAVSRAIKRAFGFSVGKATFSFFGKNPPELISVPVSHTDVIEVPWGAMELPTMQGAILRMAQRNNMELGLIGLVVVDAPRKYRHAIQGFFKLIEDELATASIYKGKAIDGATMPNFLDLTGVDPANVVYTQEVMRQLEANVWSPIRHTKALEAIGQPGKRSVLFEGPYGTGKTLAAYLTAQVAEANGWTFILCRPGRDNLMETLQTARMYQPSVVFFEDLDTVGGTGGSGDEVSRILDNFDGLQTKGLQMLLVLTTNHVESIHKGMLRPGRLDAVIHIAEMDRIGVEKLVRRVVGDALDSDVDFDEVFDAFQGFMPAFVREAIDRTVRYSVARNDGRVGSISTSDLVEAAHGLRTQLALMNSAADKVVRPTIEGTIASVVQSTINDAKLLDCDGDEMYTVRVEPPVAAEIKS